MTALTLDLPPIAPSDGVDREHDDVFGSVLPDATRFVTFSFGDDLYGVASSEVAEVVHPLTMSALPNGPAFLLGIAPLRGEIVAMVNLRDQLISERRSQSGRQKVVVLSSSEHESQIAFEVDQMHELVSIGKNEILPTEDRTVWVSSIVDYQGHHLRIIDAVALRSALG